MRVGVAGTGDRGTGGRAEPGRRAAALRRRARGRRPQDHRLQVQAYPGRPAAGRDQRSFTDIEENLRFPMPSPTELEAYVVYIGFDDAGDRNRPPPAKKSAPKKK